MTITETTTSRLRARTSSADVLTLACATASRVVVQI